MTPGLRLTTAEVAQRRGAIAPPRAPPARKNRPRDPPGPPQSPPAARLQDWRETLPETGDRNDAQSWVPSRRSPKPEPPGKMPSAALAVAASSSPADAAQICARATTLGPCASPRRCQESREKKVERRCPRQLPAKAAL